MSFASYQGTRGLGQCADPTSCAIYGAIQAGIQLVSYWKQQSANNAFKVLATTKAESFVVAMYGLEPGCELPQKGGLPIVPGGHYFCENSVAGMIERCNLAQATPYLGWLAQQMQQIAAQDPHYFGAWFDEYGIHDIPYLQRTIAQAGLICAGQQTTSPPPSGTGTSLVGGGISTTTMLLIGGAFLALLLLSQ